MAERRATRQNLVRGADRSEKIRTYNYAQVRSYPFALTPHFHYNFQERVTDHRIGLTLMNLSSVMEGDGLQDFLDALKKDHDETVLEDMLSEE